MTLLVDTSVLVKWFHAEGEGEVDAARSLLSGHRAGTERVLVLDLALYEVGNLMLRPLRLSATSVTAVLTALRAACGPFLTPLPSWDGVAASLGARHGLSFYDAAWAAAARALEVPLVSADRQLLGAGLAVSATEAADRLRG